MDKLPEEMLQEIIEYLRYSDLKCFRLVCKKFYDVSLTFRIVNRDNFAYGDQMISPSYVYKFDNFMKILSTTERNFYHFHFVNTKITVGFREFVAKRAKFILSLTIEKCQVMFDTISFCEIINECIQLKSLTLRRLSLLPRVCNCAATISLPALETMDISHIPDEMFNVLMDTNVKNLHLHVDVRQLYYEFYKRARLNDLRYVELSDFCTDRQLMGISDNLNLTTININCVAVTDRGFKYFVEKQPRLQIVEMGNCRLMTNESLFAIAEYLKDLKELKIRHMFSMPYSFDALNRIINLTPVRRLKCDVRLNYSGLATVGDVTKCLLRQLRMSDVHNETYVTYIAENFLSLIELELTDSNGVTNETLRLICRNLKNLKKLTLWGCDAICAFENDVSQLTFSANFNNLEELNLSCSGWLSDSTLETYFKLPSLRILNVSFCQQLTVKSFVAMPKNFPCLEDLNMDGLTVDKDVLLSTVSLMKRLCKLYIFLSDPITEHVLKSLYEHSDSLHGVNLGKVLDNWWFIRSWERKTFVKAGL